MLTFMKSSSEMNDLVYNNNLQKLQSGKMEGHSLFTEIYS